MGNVVVLQWETIRAPPKQRSRKVITGWSECQGIKPMPCRPPCTGASSQQTDKHHYTIVDMAKSSRIAMSATLHIAESISRR